MSSRYADDAYDALTDASGDEDDNKDNDAEHERDRRKHEEFDSDNDSDSGSRSGRPDRVDFSTAGDDPYDALEDDGDASKAIIAQQSKVKNGNQRDTSVVAFIGNNAPVRIVTSGGVVRGTGAVGAQLVGGQALTGTNSSSPASLRRHPALVEHTSTPHRDWNAEYQALVERHYEEAERRRASLQLVVGETPSVELSIPDKSADSPYGAAMERSKPVEHNPQPQTSSLVAASARASSSSADWAEAEVERTIALRALANAFAREACEIGTTIVKEMRLPAGSPTRQIPPVTRAVGGVAGGEKYIHRGIFFKAAVDFRGIYNGDENAAKAAQHELKGLMGLVGCRVRGLCFPLCAVIRYRGHCLIAQSILPIDGSRTLIYGSPDGGRTVVNLAESVDQPDACESGHEDADSVGTADAGVAATEIDVQPLSPHLPFLLAKSRLFVQKMRIAARMLNIKEHRVRPAPAGAVATANATASLIGGPEALAVADSPDGKRLSHHAPRSLSASAGNFDSPLELDSSLAAAELASAEVSLAAPADIEGHVGHDGRMYVCDTARVFPPQLPRSSIRGCFLFNLLRPEFVRDLDHPLSSDAFSKFGRSEAAEHNAEVRAASLMLEGLVIPNFINDLCLRLAHSSCDKDSSPLVASLAAAATDQHMPMVSSPEQMDCSEHLQLSAEMHSRGINLRFLLSVWRRIESLLTGEGDEQQGSQLPHGSASIQPTMTTVSKSKTAEKGGIPSNIIHLAAPGLRRLQDVIVTEMCARVCVRELRRRWREVPVVAGVSTSVIGGEDVFERTTRNFLNIVFCSAARRDFDSISNRVDDARTSWEETSIAASSVTFWRTTLPDAIDASFWGLPTMPFVETGTVAHDSRLRLGLTSSVSQKLVHLVDGPTLFVRICTLAGLSVRRPSVAAAPRTSLSHQGGRIRANSKIDDSEILHEAARMVFTAIEPFGAVSGCSAVSSLFRFEDRPRVTHIHRISFEEGTALATLAATRAADGDRGAAYELYSRATTMFAETLATKPDDQHTLFNWGLCLQRLAALELSSAKPQSVEVADRLFTEAGQKYRAAAPPGDASSASKAGFSTRDVTLLHKWALCLLEHAKMLESAACSLGNVVALRQRADRLVLEAGDKLRNAIRISTLSQESHLYPFASQAQLFGDILFNFGVARLRLHKSREGRKTSERDGCVICTLAQACFGFDQASKLVTPGRKTHFDALLNLGICEAKLAHALQRPKHSLSHSHTHDLIDTRRKLKAKAAWRASFDAYEQALLVAEEESTKPSNDGMQWKRQVAEVHFNWANALYRLSKLQIRRLAADGADVQSHARSAVMNARKTLEKCKRRYSRAVITAREAGGAQRTTVRNVERVAQSRIAASRKLAKSLLETSSNTSDQLVDVEDDGQLIVLDTLTDDLRHSASVMFAAESSVLVEEHVSSNDFFVLSRIPQPSGFSGRRTRPAPLLAARRTFNKHEEYFVLRVFGRTVVDTPRMLNAFKLASMMTTSSVDLPQFVFEEKHSVFILSPLAHCSIATLSDFRSAFPEIVSDLRTAVSWTCWSGLCIAGILKELTDSKSSLRTAPHWDEDAVRSVVQRFDLQSLSVQVTDSVDSDGLSAFPSCVNISLSMLALCSPSEDARQMAAPRGFRFPELARRSAVLEIESAASWALGCALYELLVGCAPFLVCSHTGHGHTLTVADGRTHWNVGVTHGLCLLESMTSGELWFPDHADARLRRLCSALLAPTPSERLPVSQAFAELAALNAVAAAVRIDQSLYVQPSLVRLRQAQDSIIDACHAIANAETSTDRREPTPMLSERASDAASTPNVSIELLSARTFDRQYSFSMLSLDTLQEADGPIANATLWEPELADVMAGFSFVE